MKPSVFLYEENNSTNNLYVGELSTAECLEKLDGASKITINEFGATLYKKYGWATEKDLPEIETVEDLLLLFKREGDIGLIEFEALIDGVGLVSSHDDGECNIKFKEKHTCLEFIKKLAPFEHQNLLINNLLKNQGIYVSCDESGKITKYSTFEEYVEKNV